MAHLDTTVWLKAEGQRCGDCIPSSGGNICIGTYGQPCAQPSLFGDPMLLHRALLALREVADDEGNLVDAHRISALRIHDGEAELTLTGSAGCGPSRLLAEDAFRVLRRLLPDTDVYVRHGG